MMKPFLVFLFLIANGQWTVAQCPMGATEPQLRSSLRGRLSGIQSEGAINYAISTTNYGIITYYLSQEHTVNRCTVLPKDDAMANFLSEECNRRYTTLSATEWKSYLDNGNIMEVTLTWIQKKAIFEFREVK